MRYDMYAVEGDNLNFYALKMSAIYGSVFSRLCNAETKFSMDLQYLGKQTKHGT